MNLEVRLNSANRAATVPTCHQLDATLKRSAVGIVNKNHILVGTADCKLTSHTIEEEGVTLGSPDLIAISKGAVFFVPKDVIANKAGCGILYKFFIKELFAVPTAAV